MNFQTWVRAFLFSGAWFIAFQIPVTAAAEPEGLARAAAPLYLAKVPEAFVLRYQVRKRGLVGEGELRWAPEGSGYELTLEGKVLGLQLLHQVSRGALSPQGLAPRYFSDQRARGAAQSATFDQDSGAIHYLGGAAPVTWVAGVQDRLSWMVQLPAVLQAEPQLQVPGQQVLLYVSGARGDADLWAFQFVAFEDIQAPQGRGSWAKWVRQPRRPNDTLVEVWLDPARQWLPVRAHFGSDVDSLELSLQPTKS